MNTLARLSASRRGPVQGVMRRLHRLRGDAGSILPQALIGMAILLIAVPVFIFAGSQMVQRSTHLNNTSQRELYATSYVDELAGADVAPEQKLPGVSNVSIGGQTVTVTTWVTATAGGAVVGIAMPIDNSVPTGACAQAATSPDFQRCVIRTASVRSNPSFRAPMPAVGTYTQGSNTTIGRDVADGEEFITLVPAGAGSVYRYTFHVSGVAGKGTFLVFENGVVDRKRIDATTNSDFYGEISTNGTSDPISISIQTTTAHISNAYVYQVH